MFPIYVYEEGTELPKSGTYFVVASNGMFMHKDVGIVKALVQFDADKVPMLKDFEPPKRKAVPVYICDGESELPEDEDYFLIAKNGVFEHGSKNKVFAKAFFRDIPNLGALQTFCRFELPKIPVEIIWRSLLFFRRVWYTYKAEAAVILYYNKATKEYFLHAPRQQVGGASVSYGTLTRGVADPEEAAYISEMKQKGYVRIGTIHSHCNFNAFHSGVDTDDEASWPDGVHITIGHVDGKVFSLASSLVANNNRFQVDPTDLVLGLKRKIPKKSMGFRTQESFFDVILSTEEREALLDKHQKQIEEEWMPKVGDTFAFPKKKSKGISLFDTLKNIVSPAPVSQDMQQMVDAVADAKEESRFLRLVRVHANALLNSTGLTEDSRKHLLSTLQKFFRKDNITAEDINTASLVDAKNPEFYAAKGCAVE